MSKMCANSDFTAMVAYSNTDVLSTKSRLQLFWSKPLRHKPHSHWKSGVALVSRTVAAHIWDLWRR